MAEKRRGLGRGLGALISGSPVSEDEGVPAAAVPAAESSLTQDSKVKVSTSQGAATSASGAADVSRETKALPDASKVSRETTNAKDSVNGGSRSPSDSEGTVDDAEHPQAESRISSSTPSAKAVRSTGKESTRKSRPVDMFFSPGTTESSSSNSGSDAPTAKKSTANSRSRRVAVPDVLGQVMQQKDDRGVPDESNTDTELENASLPDAESQSLNEDAIGPDAVSRETLIAVPGATFAEVAVGDIHPNRKQPRTSFDEDDMAELVHSIREVGLLQPIVVRPSGEDSEEKYELVMGERRWRAVQAAGLSQIPAIIRNTSNTDLLRDALLENLHRSQLNPLEEAAAYQQLMQEFECTQEELSDRIGRSRPQISNTIRLMKLPALVQRRVAAGVLTAGHARALLGLSDNAEMERVAQRIVNEGLSVRATEELVAMSDGLRRPTREKTPKSTARHERLDYLANSLSDHLDTNVKITLGAKKGRVSIEFGSVDDLNRIMSVISPTPEK
jgi:ParB-like partition proteins